MAIAFGNAPILARYLREADLVPSAITNLIAFMLDPKAQPDKDPDGDDGSHWCGTWRLKFERTGRGGNLKNFAEIDMGRLRIGLYIDALIKNGEKAEAAKQNAVEKFGISLAHAKKALKAARAFHNYNPSPSPFAIPGLAGWSLKS
jgi:hypothetical protein